MEVAVKPSLLRRYPIWDQHANLAKQVVALRDEAVGKPLAQDRQFGALVLQPGQHVGGGGLELAPPFCYVAGTDRFRREIGIIVSMLSQCAMHLGGAQPELA